MAMPRYDVERFGFAPRGLECGPATSAIPLIATELFRLAER